MRVRVFTGNDSWLRESYEERYKHKLEGHTPEPIPDYIIEEFSEPLPDEEEFGSMSDHNDPIIKCLDELRSK